MEYNTLTLPSGLRVIHLPATSQQVVYCGYAIGAGTRHELPGEEGLAHFVEHTTFKGTTHRTAMQVLNGLERVGGDLNAFTTKEHTIYHAAVLRNHVGRAVELLSDIVFNSVYPQAEIEKEIEVVCDEIESYNDSPAELIYDEFENLLFPGHPLGHNILGTAAQLHTYTADDARRFARRHYRPDNAVFFAYGDVSFEGMVKRISRCIDSSSRSEERGARSENSSARSEKRGARNENSPVAESNPEPRKNHQAHVMTGALAFGANDERRWPLFVVNNLLGGPSMNARLNLALRERRGLVYTVESSMTTYADTGTWSIYFGCDHDDVKRCLRLVRNELDRLMDRPLSPRQLAAAKQQLKGQLAIAADNREQFALDMGRLFLHEHREHHISRMFSHIDSVTAGQIQQVAQQVFAPGQMKTLIL